MHAMTKREGTPGRPDWKALLAADEDGFRAVLQTVLQEVLEVEMTAALQSPTGLESGTIRILMMFNRIS